MSQRTGHRHRILAPAILFVAVAMLGCSAGDEDSEEGEGDHVWKGQTRTMDKAREVEDVLREKAERQKASE